MKKFLFVAVVALCVLFVSCDADSIQNTSKGLQGMSNLNLADEGVKTDSLVFMKDTVVVNLEDVATDITGGGGIYDKDYMSILAVVVNDVGQKGQEKKLREALSVQLGENSLYSPDYEPKSFSALIDNLLNMGADDMVAEVNSLLSSFEIAITINPTLVATASSRIQKIAKAVLPAAVAFDTVNDRISGHVKFTAADYLTYRMLIAIMENVADFLNSGDTSLVNLLDSQQADNVQVCINAVSIINDVDFNLPAIVSGL